MDLGIVFEGERAAIVEQLSEALQELGLARDTSDTLSPEILAALNDYRIANALPALDFADPAALLALGIECDGSEVLMLARYAQQKAATEIELFDHCLEAVNTCQAHGISIWEYTKMSDNTEVSDAAVTAAILALLY